MPLLPRVARAAAHFGEEPCISGEHGSGTIFFSGCSLSCVFCQNHPISHDDFGQTISVEHLSEILIRLSQSGVHNINLVNPTHYAHVLRPALEKAKLSVPVVYNAGGYERTETLRTLDGLIDIYLPDYKYADDTLANELSGAPHYSDTALAAIEEMLRQTGHMQLENGLAVRGTMVRHLVLPGHIKNSLQVLDNLAERFSNELWISLMFQYTPVRELPDKALNRVLTARECQKVFDRLCGLDMENGYVQDRSSASDRYIPMFDLTGIE